VINLTFDEREGAIMNESNESITSSKMIQQSVLKRGINCDDGQT
jgi:hypothetical protein